MSPLPGCFVRYCRDEQLERLHLQALRDCGQRFEGDIPALPLYVTKDTTVQVASVGQLFLREAVFSP